MPAPLPQPTPEEWCAHGSAHGPLFPKCFGYADLEGRNYSIEWEADTVSQWLWVAGRLHDWRCHVAPWPSPHITVDLDLDELTLTVERGAA